MKLLIEMQVAKQLYERIATQTSSQIIRNERNSAYLAHIVIIAIRSRFL